MTKVKSVSQSVRDRHSVRAFLDRPVERTQIEDLLALAARAPSGGNLQPWQVHVRAGEALEQIRARVHEALVVSPGGEGSEFPVYPPKLAEPWRSRRSQVGEQLYASIGISREDRAGRLRQFARNFDLFGAPVGLFFTIDRRFGPPQWAHLGMFIQSLMLLADEQGLGSCAQESWALVHRTLAAELDLPESQMIYCGLALGWSDPDHPINRWRSDRVPVSEFATFAGF